MGGLHHSTDESSSLVNCVGQSLFFSMKPPRIYNTDSAEENLVYAYNVSQYYSMGLPPTSGGCGGGVCAWLQPWSVLYYYYYYYCGQVPYAAVAVFPLYTHTHNITAATTLRIVYLYIPVRARSSSSSYSFTYCLSAATPARPPTA